MNQIYNLIREERERQCAIEGFTNEHDDFWAHQELARAAAYYATPRKWRDNLPNLLWPFLTKWFKPTPENRQRELIKAAALIVAEIERLSRKDEKDSINSR
jgi:hypothetical protein